MPPLWNVLYSEKDHEHLPNLFALHMRALRVAGHIPLVLPKWWPRPVRSMARLGWQLYLVFVVMSTLHMSLLLAKTAYDAFWMGDLNDITDALNMLIIYAFSWWATSYWIWRGRDLKAFLDAFNRNYRHHSLPGLTFVSAYDSYRRAHRASFYWLMSCYFSVLTMAFTPILLGVRMLPLKCWYPFDALQPGVYELIYGLQIFAQLNTAFAYGTGSAIFGSISCTLLGQYDVLYCSIKNIIHFADLLTSSGDLDGLRRQQEEALRPDKTELNQYIASEEHQTDLHALKAWLREHMHAAPQSHESIIRAALIDCIQHHEFVAQCCRRFEELFNPYCLFKSLEKTLAFCLMIFVGVEGEKTPMRILSLCQYLGLMFSELTLFTYCGELLSSHSVRVGDAFWRSPWYLYPVHMRHYILIFLSNSKRAVRLTAGKFYFMDVQRLRLVLTQAFSFLTLLQKLAQKTDDK